MELIATAESVEQAKELLHAGVDVLYVGEDEFGLRLPTSFSKEEIKEIVDIAHAEGKKVCVAVNALLHNDRIEKVIPYLQYLQSIHVDSVTVGDPGAIHLMKQNGLTIPYIYDAQTMVTSANQVNFWAKRGAIGAVLAREIPYKELNEIQRQTMVPVEVLVYGATCIHQSMRPLVQNYFNYVGDDKEVVNERQLFLSEPKKEHTHYSIYEDRNGTHIFASDDVSLLTQLSKLDAIGIHKWKLDGIFAKGDRFVQIARVFDEARTALTNGNWTDAIMQRLHDQLLELHPVGRTLNEGFFLKKPEDVQ
ncbi:peptidase U32 family protein [Sporosarcina sp. UB5]|uniref:peptidase U32 family protein n=1 Tax=Sporosarcina sp. UB5 TaxID=3047463 RepID=UPI003D78EF80